MQTVGMALLQDRRDFRMDHIKKLVNIQVDGTKKYQRIDGFGVNINSKYWDNGGLIPVMDLLVNDLGAKIFRLDAYGKSNWIDPENKYDAGILNSGTYEKVYEGSDFKNAAAMGRYLNSVGIEPYMTLSGVVPKWMCGADGKTLEDFGSFAEMAASYVDWARNKAGIKFSLFGPLNETDYGPPEGPYVSPENYVIACEALADALDRRGLKDIKLVVAEQGAYNLDFVNCLIKSEKLKERIAAFGMHAYSDYHCTDLMDKVGNSEYYECSVWMTEYGDLEQTGEKEWYVAWVSFQRLMRLLEDGMNGALNWDAYDNYHDHDEAWTIYGIIRNARRLYTPKKRYYSAKQVYRFVKPGFQRIAATSAYEAVHVLAFASEDGKDFTIAGMNGSCEDVYLNINVQGLEAIEASRKADVYRTTANENCVRTATVNITTRDWPFNGIELVAPAYGIFTATTVK